MRILKPLALLAALMSPALAEAQNKAVVVELYTSQGCSSCPSADAYLGEISKRNNVIALSLHVDYWDYMGWKDAFADPKYTKRQRRYARVNRERTVYTPQMVVQGQELLVGSRRKSVEPHLKAHANQPQNVDLTIVQSNGRIVININALRRVKPSVVQLVRFSPQHKVAIKRGENRGRTLVYTNVVESWDIVGNWSGRGSERLSVATKPGANYAVIVQEKNQGAVLAAAKVN